jgi:hypothetical protein
MRADVGGPSARSGRAPTKRPELIDDTGPSADQPVANPMERLQIELIDCLQWDKPHRRSLDRFPDRLRIQVVVLLRLHKRAHALRRHEPHVVPMGFETLVR